MKRTVFVSLIITTLFSVVVSAQQLAPVRTLHQRSIEREREVIKTQGVVTLILPNGYYIQDINDTTSSKQKAIFVNSDTSNIALGNELVVRGTIINNGNHYEIIPDSNIVLLAEQQHVTAQAVTFPDDFTTPSAYEGMTITLQQTLYVTSNASLQRYGDLTLSSHRLMVPTEVTIPGSQLYRNMVTTNTADQLILNSSTQTNSNPIPFADANGTRRTGSRIDNLTGVYFNTPYGYKLNPSTTPIFYGNERPTAPATQSSQSYNLKVVSFNIEYYLAENYGQGYGPKNATEAAKQHNKIVAALLAMDADIYGLVEIQTGQNALIKLVNALNAATTPGRYAYINDGTSTNGTFTKVGYIYRTDKVRTVNNLRYNNTGVNNRKKAQGFELISNGARFIYSLNHFKSKSGDGTGDDADKNDGQGSFNAARVEEAESIISNISGYKSYYGDNDVLITGDLNAYSQEDPVRTLEDAGFTNLLTHFNADSAYSYSYHAQVGLLDHAMANSSLLSQVVDAQPFHINCDELSMFEYNQTTATNDMYRCSDHDPIVIMLNLSSSTPIDIVDDIQFIVVSNTEGITLHGVSNSDIEVYNTIGQQIVNTHADDNLLQLPPLPNGNIYIIKITNNTHSEIHKVVR